MKILHFESFVKFYEEKDDSNNLQLNEVIDIINNDGQRLTSVDSTLSVLKDFFQHYDLYLKDTISGKHGRTPQYVMTYVSLVDLFHSLERGIRTSDIALSYYATYEICALFFVFNHQNYARWLTRHQNNFVNIDVTHPGLREELLSGALSIRRTTKNFCRSPVDLTLEQTINANAANKLTGISAFTNNLDARQRWSETHTARTAIISNFFELINLVKFKEDASTKYHGRIFTQKVEKLTRQIRDTMNPFDDNINPHELFNLSSGKATSLNTAEFLANVRTIGIQQRDDFLKECVDDPSRFDRAIKRNHIHNFSSENIKSKKSSGKTIDEASVERNVLAQLLCQSMNRKMNLLDAFSYPLTIVPLSLAHMDGTIISNSRKGELTSLLIAHSQIETRASKPEKFDVEVIDGFHYLSILREPPMKYGRLAEFLLKRICDCDSFEIHIIFDKPEASCIRDLDIQQNIYDHSMQYKISGPNQERTGSLSKCLYNSSFRSEFVRFLINHWANMENTTAILGDKRVFLSYGNQCHLYSRLHEMKKCVSNFENNHIETDTKIILHVNQIAVGTILIKVSSADTLMVYLLYHMQFWPNEKQVWIEHGDTMRNAAQLVNVSEVFRKLSPILINALPAWHAYTGCIYEPAFYGKTRKTCFKLLQKDIKFQSAFADLDKGPNSSHLNDSLIEEYTCQLYQTRAKTVNEARLQMFESSCKSALAKGKTRISSKSGKTHFVSLDIFLTILISDYTRFY